MPAAAHRTEEHQVGRRPFWKNRGTPLDAEHVPPQALGGDVAEAVEAVWHVPLAITQGNDCDAVVRNPAQGFGKILIKVGEDACLLECRASQDDSVGVPALMSWAFHEPGAAWIVCHQDTADSCAQQRRLLQSPANGFDEQAESI